MQVGFTGLGVTGTPMAGNLAAGGHARQEPFDACAARGGTARNHSAMVRALETTADVKAGQTVKSAS